MSPIGTNHDLYRFANDIMILNLLLLGILSFFVYSVKEISLVPWPFVTQKQLAESYYAMALLASQSSCTFSMWLSKSASLLYTPSWIALVTKVGLDPFSSVNRVFFSVNAPLDTRQCPSLNW